MPYRGVDNFVEVVHTPFQVFLQLRPYDTYSGRIGVGAQSTVGGRHFCRKIMYEKLTKCPKFTCYLPEKNYQSFRIFMIFARKMPEFYMIIARKIFSDFVFLFFFGGGARALLPAPTPPTPELASPSNMIVNIWLRSTQHRRRLDGEKRNIRHRGNRMVCAYQHS